MDSYKDLHEVRPLSGGKEQSWFFTNRVDNRNMKILLIEEKHIFQYGAEIEPGIVKAVVCDNMRSLGASKDGYDFEDGKSANSYDLCYYNCDDPYHRFRHVRYKDVVEEKYDINDAMWKFVQSFSM